MRDLPKMTISRETFELSMTNKIPLFIKRKKREAIIRKIVLALLIVDLLFMVCYSCAGILEVVQVNHFICIGSLLIGFLLLLYYIINN